MNNLLMWVAGLLALVLCALFAVPPLIDWNQYRGVFEEEVSRLLGREVRVGGRVSLRILPVPYVGFEKVRIADAPGIPGTFMRAERFTVLLSVPPLLRGIIEARQLEIDSPVVRLRFDENGGGNWQTLEVRQKELAFVPSDIALQSARIRDGRLLFENHTGQSVASLDGITGELAAGTLQGPYKFIGAATWAGARHELRVSTAAADSDGGVRLKLTAESTASRARHTIDGRLSDLATVPKIVGQLTTRAPLMPAAAAAKGDSSFYDLRANVDLRPTSAQLNDITVSFDSAGRPQMLTGQARADWQDQLAVTGALNSKWIDLDAISRARTRQNPFMALQMLAGGAFDLAGTGRGRFDISIEQANLGSEVVSALRVRVTQAGDVVRVDRISAALPGRTQLRADGIVQSDDKGAAWSGHLLLRGASLKRFLAWARPDAVDVDGRAAGTFEFDGRVDWQPTAINFSQATATFAGGTLRGSLDYAWGKTRRLVIDGETARIDLTGIADDLLAPANLSALVASPPAAAADEAARLSRAIRTTDLLLRLRAGEIVASDRSLRDVDVSLTRTGDKVSFGRSKLTLEPGLALEVEGELTRRDGSPHWDLNGIVGVRQPQAFARFEELATLVAGDNALPSGFAKTQPLHVAFTSRSAGTGEAHRTVISADGMLRSDRLRFSFESSGPLASWRSQPMRLELKIDGRSNDTLAALLGWSGEVTAPQPESAAPASPSFLRLNASGNPSRRMIASATLAGGGSQLRLRARASAPGEGSALRWQGDGSVRADSAAQGIRSLAPKWARLVRATVPVAGRFEFAETAEGLVVEPVDVRVGKATLSGRVALRAAGEQRPRPSLRGRLEVDKVAGGAIIAALAGTTPPAPSSDAAPASTDYWSDQPFDLAGLTMLDVDVKVTAGSLALGHGLVLSKAAAAVAISDGNLALSRLSGELFGGRLDASASLRAAAAGAELELSASLDAAQLQRLTAAALRDRVAGRANLAMSAKGQALSPRALATALSGKGRLSLIDVTVPGLPLSSLSAVADAVVVGDITPDELTEKLRLEAERGAITVGSKDVALRLADGALRIEAFNGDGDSSAARNTTTIDVVAMLIDSEWRIDTRLVRSAKPNDEGRSAARVLPTVQVVYTGPLTGLSAIAPRIGTGDLQRELTVRRMEHDVKRLEELRREDESRARAETQRLRLQERQRIRALEEEARKRGQLAPSSGTVRRRGIGPRSYNSTGPAATQELSSGTLPPVTDPAAGQRATNLPPPPTSAAAAPAAVEAQPPPRRRRRKAYDPFAIDN